MLSRHEEKELGVVNMVADIIDKNNIDDPNIIRSIGQIIQYFKQHELARIMTCSEKHKLAIEQALKTV